MFGMNENRENKKVEFNIFDVKSVDEFIDRLKVRFNRTLEEEIKEQLKKLKIEYKRDDQNAIIILV